MAMERSTRNQARSDELPDEVLAYLYSSLIFLLRRADQRAVTLFNDAARDLGLTLPQFHILYIASEVGSFPQGELARQVATGEATASTTISKLIENGFLSRITDEADARRKLIEATSAGREIVAAALPAFRSALSQLEAPLPGGSTQLNELLYSLIERAGGEIDIPSNLSDVAAQRLNVVHHSSHFLVRRAIQIIEAETNPWLATTGITLRQYVVLLIATLRPGIGESRIASTIGLDLSNASFIARGLRKKGLVSVDESSRRRRYEPTQAGREFLAVAEPVLVGAVSSRLCLLDEQDREQLLKLLGQIVGGGGGSSAPPAFSRISARPNWPTAQRPSQFDQIIRVRHEPTRQDLIALLGRAGQRVTTNPEEIDRLSADDAALLEQLLTQLLQENPDQAAG